MHVGEHCGLDEVALIAHAVAAGHQLGLLLLPGVNVAHHFVELVLIHLRTLFGVLVEGIADGALLGAGHALLHKLVVNLLLDVQPRPRAAALSLVEEKRKMRALDGLVHIRVGKHDVRAFSTEFQRHALQVGIGRGAHDQMAHFRRSRERHFVHVHVPRYRRTGRWSISGQQVHHAFREPRFQHQFANTQRRQRCLLCRLHHHGTAAGQRRPKFPRLHQKWKIPRNNLPHHTHGLVLRVGEVIAANGNRLPLILVRPSRVVAVARDGQRKIGCPRHVVRFAVVQRLKLCQLIGVLLDQIRQLVHQYAALRSAHLAPRALVERRARCRHRLVHIRRVGLRHLRDHFTRRWIDRRERFSRSAVHPFPVDQKFCRANLDIPFHHCRCGSHF